MHESQTPRPARHYKELIVWQRAMHLVKSVYRLTKSFPPEERHSLALQMRRAAVSVPSNIAEGQAQRGPKGFTHFLSIARGSLQELETQLQLAIDLGHLKRADAAPAAGEIVEVEKTAAIIRRKLIDRSEGADRDEE